MPMNFKISLLTEILCIRWSKREHEHSGNFGKKL